MPRKVEGLEFKSAISTADNCVCNACFGTGRVIKVGMLETHFDNKGVIRTWREDYWLCRECRDKLVKALEWEE